jgi:uridine phosphorylase
MQRGPIFNWQQPSAPAFDEEGRIQPLNCKKGELANRIITVGDPNRAAKFKDMFDQDQPIIVRQSNMIFATYTGKIRGIPVSVVATGMGFAMAELLIVQARAIVDGPMCMIRFGTCGSLHADVPVGCFAVTDKVYGVRQSYEQEEFPYEITKTSCLLDEGITEMLQDGFAKELPEYRTVTGPGFSADTFYGSQGRLDDAFVNNNDKLIATILQTDPEALNFEMETYLLGFVASKLCKSIKVGAICITLAQRTSGDFLTNEVKYDMEQKGGKLLVDILTKVPLE